MHLIGIPDGVRNFGGVLDLVAARSRNPGAFRATSRRSIDIDVTDLAIGHSIFVRDSWRRRSRSSTIRDVPICTVVAPRTEEAAVVAAAEDVAERRAGADPEAEARGRGRRRSKELTPLRAILGLGNPGPEYAATRHNAGFRLADHLAARWRFGAFRRARARAESRVGMARPGQPVRLIKPPTYMNRSGAALAPLRARPGFDPARDLLVLVDDVALPAGPLPPARAPDRAGGHNGLKSIEGRAHAAGLCPAADRRRAGAATAADDLADFVLDPFDADERTALNDSARPDGRGRGVLAGRRNRVRHEPI